MSFSLLLPVHISAGILGILSGATALSFRKGSRRHAQAGKVFVLAMLTMAASAVYLALMKHQTNNVFGGVLTFYLLSTAWLTTAAPGSRRQSMYPRVASRRTPWGRNASAMPWWQRLDIPRYGAVSTGRKDW